MGKQKETREQAGALLWAKLAGANSGVAHSLDEAMKIVMGK